MLKFKYHILWGCYELLILQLPPVVAAMYSNEDSSKICRELLPDEYKLHESPRKDDNPVNIFCRMHIIDLYDINEEAMEFRLSTYIGFSWLDHRLNFSKSLMFSPCARHIWQPNAVYEITKDVYRFDMLYLNITRDVVQTSEKMSFKVPCDMHFEDYPFDSQHCDFTIGLLATPDYEVLLKWYTDKNSPHKLPMAISYEKNITSLQFYFTEPTLSNATALYFDGDEYTYLIIRFTLVRQLMGSILNIYVPSTLVVAVSWLNFWIRVEAAPARVALSITSLLTLCTQIHQHKSHLPPINYITAMDIWLFVCIVMVFATFVEFAFSYSLNVPEVKVIPGNETSSIVHRMPDVHGKNKTHKSMLTEDSKAKQTFSHRNRIDQVSKVAFPSFFLVFTLCYGSYCASIRWR